MSRATYADAVVPRFESLIGQRGLHIHDPVEDVQTVFYTDQSIEPIPTPTDEFLYPVDSAAQVSATRLKSSFLLGIWVRDRDGNVVAEFDPNDGSISVPTGDYLLEFGGTVMKIYARISDVTLTITADDDQVCLEFGETTPIRIGARSMHTQPARTLQTTSEPEALMEAVSLFGNAMKTWSPERTFPSLRGHPPLLELDTTTALPDGLTPPETGITLTVPPDHSWLFPAAPLAYWLGATVTPGSPALHLNSSRYPLGTAAGYSADSEQQAYEQHIRDILQFSFFFDCAVRTEGFYTHELDARRRLEAVGLPLDFAGLYGSSIAERVQTYLDLGPSFETLADRVGRPGWRLTADVQPDPDRATIMPFLARDLAVVRCPSTRRLQAPPDGADAGLDAVLTRRPPGFDTEPMHRGSPNQSPAGRENDVTESPGEGTAGSGAVTRSSNPSEVADRAVNEPVIGLPDAESMSQAWVGEGFAVRAAKASTTSYLQRLESHAQGASGISVDVIVNNEEMAEEESVSEIYGTRELLEFDVTVHKQLSRTALADVLEGETDFIHYIGHVDTDGFECADGFLDAGQLGTIEADMFVLNACASYEQGQRLVDSGAIAGVVTLEDVINSMATKIGKTVARLLNYGFPIGSATNVIQETIFTGSNYVVVGDSNATMAQSNVPVPNVARVSLRGDGLFDVTVETFASWNYDIGSFYRPYIEGCECHYVVPGELDTWRVDDSTLDAFLDTSTFPVIGRSNLFWSDELTAASLRDRL